MLEKMEYDIVVGINTQDCASTVSDIVQKVDNSLTKDFSKLTSLIICADGYSKDKTRKNFQDTKTITEKKFITEKGKRGKGSAVRTVIEKARMHNAKVVVLIDGDHMNLKAEWVSRMIEAILSKKQDIAAANYISDKNDFLMNNHFIYPVVKSLLDINLKHILAGEYSLSDRACMKLLNSKFFPSDQGIDVFISLTGLCENLNMAEVKLGVKKHSSSEKYNSPEDTLMPLFNQVAKELIALLRYYKSTVRRDVKLNIKKLGKYDAKVPSRVEISLKSYENLSRGIINSEEDYALKLFEAMSDQSIMGMKVAWLNWLAYYFEQTKNMSSPSAHKVLDKLVKAFEKHKDQLKL